MQYITLALFGAVLAFPPASGSTPTAAVQRYDASITACTSMADMDMQQCLAPLLQSVEAEHRQTYRSAIKATSVTGRAAELRKAEAAWRKFVGAQCAFDSSQFSGGTGFWPAAYICKIKREAIRIDELSRGLSR